MTSFLCFFLALGLMAAKWSVPIVVITSSNTPDSTKSQVLSGIPAIKSALEFDSPGQLSLFLFWTQANVSSTFAFPEIIYEEQAQVVLDVTCDSAYSRYLAYHAYESNFLHLVFERPAEVGEASSPNTIFMEPSPYTQAEVFARLIPAYNWTNLGLFYNTEDRNRESAKRFSHSVIGTGAQILDEVEIDELGTVPLLSISDRIATTKNSGAKVFVVFTDVVTAAQILISAEETGIGGSGYVWILNDEAMKDLKEIARLSNADVSMSLFGLLKTGIVGFVAEEADYALQEPMHNYLSALTLVVQAYESIEVITGVSLRTYFLSNPGVTNVPYPIEFSKTGEREVQYVAYNMVDFTLYKVGFWGFNSTSLSRTGRNIVWPGGSTRIPNDKVSIFQIAVLYPKTDSLGNASTDGQSILQGVQLALKDINSGSGFIKNCVFEAIYLNTAESFSLAKANINSVASVSFLGFIGPLASDIVTAYVQATDTLPDAKPMVSYGASSANLTNPNTTPRFLRTIQPDGLQAIALALFIRFVGWQRVGVIYTNDDYGLGLYSSFYYNSATLQIQSVNSESTRAVVPDDNGKLTSETVADIAAALNDLIVNQIRIIVYLGSWRVGAELVLQAKYKQLTGANYAWLGAMWVSPGILKSLQSLYSASQYSDLLSALEGCIALDYLGVQGDVGVSFQQSYIGNFTESPTIYSILARDAVYLYAYTVSSMISRQEDFYNGKDLLAAMRTAEFQGASGMVQFSSETNDRSANGYSVLNMQGGNLTQVAIYDPISADQFNRTTITLKWAGSSPPNDTFPVYSCPFPAFMVSVSVSGLEIVVIIGSILFLIAVTLSLFSYSKWKVVQTHKIKERVFMTWQDFTVELAIGIEFFGLLSIAPSLNVALPQQVISALSSLMMSDVMTLLSLPHPYYWIQLSVICVLCYIWFILVLITMLSVENWLKKLPGCSKLLDRFTEMYLPLLGNTLFFPFSSQLVNAFVCDHQVLGRGFAWIDCTMYCWTSEHLTYVSLSAIALLVFQPLAVYSQPMWQQTSAEVNLMLEPFFLLFQTCSQILLIVVGKSLQGISAITHGCVFSVLILVYAAVAVVVRPFNYSRCNLWEITSLVGVLLYSIIATLSQVTGSTNSGWFIALAAGWTVIGLFSLFIQIKFLPSLLKLPLDRTGRKTLREAIIAGLHLRKGPVLAETTPQLDTTAIAPGHSTPALGLPLSDDRVLFTDTSKDLPLGLLPEIVQCLTGKNTMIPTVLFSLLMPIDSNAYRVLPIVLVTSSNTPESTLSSVLSEIPSLKSRLESDSLSIWWFWEHVDLSDSSIGYVFPESVETEGAKVFLDVSCDLEYSRYLAYQAYLIDVLQVVLERSATEGEASSPNTVFMEPSPEAQADIISNLISAYGWTQLGLIYNKEDQNQRTATRFKTLLNSSVQRILDEVEIDQNAAVPLFYVENRLGTTKTSGAKVFAVFADPVTAADVLLSADENEIGGSGFVWILNNEAMGDIQEIVKFSNADVAWNLFGLLKTGVIGLRVEEADYALQEPMHNYISALSLIVQAYQLLTEITGTTLITYILSNPGVTKSPYPVQFKHTGIRDVRYTAFNMVDFMLYEIGAVYFNSTTLIPNSHPITWPGEVAHVPNDLVSIMKIAVLYPETDSLGNSLSTGRAIRQAVQLALEEINSGSGFIHNYVFEPIYLNTAESHTLVQANINSVASIDFLGFIGPLFSDLVHAYVQATETLPDAKPMVSYGASSANLTNSETTPWFLRTIQPDGLQSVAVALLIRYFSWKQVAVIYTSDDYGLGLYSSFYSNMGDLQITIVNSESTRAVVPDDNGKLTSETVADIAAALNDLIVNQIRIIVYLGSWRVGAELVLQAKYKQLTGANYAWLGAMWVSPGILKSLQSLYSASQYSDLLSALEGCIALDYLGVQGDVGVSFQQSYIGNFTESPTIYSILARDAVYLYAYTVSSMISQQENFFNGGSLLAAMRTAEFKGASGMVQFSSGTNDRSAYGYSVLNMQGGNLTQVAIYDPISADLFNRTTITVKWAGSSPPNDTFPIYNCPFPEFMVSISPQGVGVVIAIGSTLFLVTLVLSLFSFSKWKLVEIRLIKEHVRKTWRDSLVELTILIEFFQLLALAPHFEALQIAMTDISDLVMLDIMNMSQVKQATNSSDYWKELTVICVLCYLWFFSVLAIALNADKWLKNFKGCYKLWILATGVYLPLVGNTLFLPFTTLLLDAFVCDHQKQGQEFVSRDCYMTCWTSEHSGYVSMSAIAVILFEPMAVFSRPMWQQAKLGLNLMLKPLFLLFKTCIQILLIAVGKSLQGTSTVGHGCVFSVLMLAYCAVAVRVLPFNYGRCNLWEIATLVAVLYFSLLATFSNALNPSNLGWFVALLVGWAVICVAAMVLQCKRFPSHFRLPGTERKVMEVLGVTRNRERNEAEAEEDLGAMDFDIAAPSVTIQEANEAVSTPPEDSIHDCKGDTERSDMELRQTSATGARWQVSYKKRS